MEFGTNIKRTSMNPTVGLTKRLTLKGIPSFLKKISGNVEDNTGYHDTKPREEKNPNELIQKTLVKKDPQFGKNLVYFDYVKKKWVDAELEEHYINIFSNESNVLHAQDKALVLMNEYHKKKIYQQNQKKKKEESEIPEADPNINKNNRNLISYAERTCQTFNKVILTKEVQTAKILRNNNSDIAHKFDMFDRYVLKFIDMSEKKKEEEYIKLYGQPPAQKVQKRSEKNAESLDRPSMIKTLKLVERQIMQILNKESYGLLRDWNTTDEDKGKCILMLLPFPEKNTIKNRSVTALCWNAGVEDLFAVGYGSYSFPKKNEVKERLDDEDRSDDILENGYIFVYSIKNNYFPELQYKTDTSVLSLDFHPVKTSYLVAGMYDGTVSVFDIKQKIQTPIILCDIKLQRHMDPVWQVKWYRNSEKDEYIFFSISSDGKINKWRFWESKKAFEQEEIILVKYAESRELSIRANPDAANEPVDEAFIFGNAGGMCIDFNPHKDYEHYFIIGTEEGHIHICSVNHRGHIMNSYEGHSMAVYNLSWNPYHPKIFLSCSADWSIKVWHYKTVQAILVFDFQCPIGSIAWSPWCSTIFSAVSVQGDILFYDLNRDRKSYIFKKDYQKIAINHIVFNKFEHVFLTGNEKGKVRLWRIAEYLKNTVNQNELKEKEKAKLENDKKTNTIETKVNLPRHLIEPTTHKKKHIDIKKVNNLEMINSVEFKTHENQRIKELLDHLDIKDN
jgi:dynein intermediate chain 1